MTSAPDHPGEPPRTRTALVLGAGGVVGRAYHLAALRALERRHGWTPDDADLVVGTSAGALVGTLLRAGIGPDEQLDHLTEVASDLGPQVTEVAGVVPVTPDISLRLGRPTVPPRRLWQRLRTGPGRTPAVLSALLPRGRAALTAHAAWFDRLLARRWPTGLAICAVRLPDLARVVWTGQRDDTPSIGTAVTASCAVPGFIAPVAHGQREYVDGGLHTPTNLDVLLDHDVDRVVVVAPMATGGGHTLARPDRPLRWLWHRSLRGEVDRLRRAGVRTVVIEPDADEYRRMPPNLLDGRDLPAVTAHLAAHLEARLGAAAFDPGAAHAA